MDTQESVWRNHIYMIEFEPDVMLYRNHAHIRFAGKQFRKSAFMTRVQVLNKNKSHVRLRRQVLKQFGECLQPACRGPNTHHHQVVGGFARRVRTCRFRLWFIHTLLPSTIQDRGRCTKLHPSRPGRAHAGIPVVPGDQAWKESSVPRRLPRCTRLRRNWRSPASERGARTGASSRCRRRASRPI